ncbi:TnsD family Tn7-like transposition protein [Hydrogenophaga sp.]|uniref:TnsD family Tn7-like transposition protein n=1 Tax=Hydrogenophaga sp. TaxID=1904254 RepID=UPI003F6EB6D8
MESSLKIERPNGLTLVAWLPGETLFSLAARHHFLWGHAVSSRTAAAMFGDRHLGTHHDLPSGLDRFTYITRGVLGKAAEISRERTVLKYYLPFLTPERSARAVSTMRLDSVAHLKFRLGLLTSQFRANHPLKACRVCMQIDTDQFGWSYWHREHQYPGIWLCRYHGVPLLRSTLKSTGVSRFGWNLPRDAELVYEWRAKSSTEERALMALSHLVAEIVELEDADGWLQPVLAQRTFRKRMEDRGWLLASGKFRMEEAARDFLRFSESFLGIPEFKMLPRTVEESKIHVQRLLRPLRTGTHPLRLLLAVAWLFRDTADFLREHIALREASSQESPASTGASRGGTALRAEHQARARVIQLLAEGLSATSAARDVGVDVATAMAWAAHAGYVASRRPKTLTAERRAELIADLRLGSERSEVASKHHVSLSTISRIIQTELEVYRDWKIARDVKKAQKAKHEWMVLTAAYPNTGNKLLRAMRPSAYAWLYRHDREWLRQHSTTTSVVSAPVQRTRVRWDERDVALSKLVEVAVLRLHERHPGKRLRLWQIYQEVPELKAKLPVINRLVLTGRVLERALLSPSRDHDCLF